MSEAICQDCGRGDDLISSDEVTVCRECLKARADATEVFVHGWVQTIQKDADVLKSRGAQADEVDAKIKAAIAGAFSGGNFEERTYWALRDAMTPEEVEHWLDAPPGMDSHPPGYGGTIR